MLERRGLLWRVRLRGFAEKREVTSRPICSFLNMDLGVPRAADSRRLEVVVDCLLLFGGVQLAVDPGEELQTVTEWPLQKQDE